MGTVTSLNSTQAWRMDLSGGATIDPLSGQIHLTPANFMTTGEPGVFSTLTVETTIEAGGAVDVGGDLAVTGAVEVGESVTCDGLTITGMTAGLVVADLGVTINGGGLVVAGGRTSIVTDVYPDNTAAILGGLTPGQFYRTATGVVMTVFTP